MANRTLLEETVGRALRRKIITFRRNLIMPTLSFGRTSYSTGNIIPEKMLTLRTLRSVYSFVNRVPPECVPGPNVVLNGNLSVFRSPASAGGWSVEVGFPACSCQANECNQIVLWDCSICKNLSTKCISLTHLLIHPLTNPLDEFSQNLI